MSGQNQVGTDFTPVAIETDPDPDEDADEEIRTTPGFSVASLRQGFVRNVFGILTIQLLGVVAILGLCLFIEPKWTQDLGPVLMGPAFFFILVVILLNCCCGILTKRVQGLRNFLLLLALTLTQGLFLAVWAANYSAEGFVLLAASLTVVNTMSISLFACQSKCQFRVLSGILLAVVLVLIQVVSCLFFLESHVPVMRITYASLGTFCISVGLICDTQRLINKSLRGRHEMAPNDFAYGTLVISFGTGFFLHIHHHGVGHEACDAEAGRRALVCHHLTIPSCQAETEPKGEEKEKVT